MNKFVLAKLCAMSIGLILLLDGTARAGLVVDQQNTDYRLTYQYLAVNPGVGQSFTPSFSTLDFASFPLYTAPAPASTYRVDVYSGDGFGGAVVGSSLSQLLPVNSMQDVEFDFASPVSLTPGSRYTLRVVRVAGSNNNLTLLADFSDPYTGGSQYSYSGSIETGYDTVFSEGTGSLPEPSSIIIAIGLAALASLSSRARGIRKIVRPARCDTLAKDNR